MTMMPGETILSGAPQICGPGKMTEFFTDDWIMHPVDEETGRPVTVDVLWDVYQSGAGYYIGTMCPHCGPYTRESIYFGTRNDAEDAYKDWLRFIMNGKLDLTLMKNPYLRHGREELLGQRY